MIHMLKKLLLLFLILPASTTKGTTDNNDTKATIAAGIIGLGIAAFLIHSLNSSLQEFNQKINSKNSKRLRFVEKAAIVLIGTAIGLYAANAFYPIFKDIIDYAYPTEKQRIALIEVGQRYQLLKAKIDLENKNLQLA